MASEFLRNLSRKIDEGVDNTGAADRKGAEMLLSLSNAIRGAAREIKRAPVAVFDNTVEFVLNDLQAVEKKYERRSIVGKLKDPESKKIGLSLKIMLAEQVSADEPTRKAYEHLKVRYAEMGLRFPAVGFVDTEEDSFQAAAINGYEGVETNAYETTPRIRVRLREASIEDGGIGVKALKEKLYAKGMGREVAEHYALEAMFVHEAGHVHRLDGADGRRAFYDGESGRDLREVLSEKLKAKGLDGKIADEKSKFLVTLWEESYADAHLGIMLQKIGHEKGAELVDGVMELRKSKNASLDHRTGRSVRLGYDLKQPPGVSNEDFEKWASDRAKQIALNRVVEASSGMLKDKKQAEALGLEAKNVLIDMKTCAERVKDRSGNGLCVVRNEKGGFNGPK